MPTEISLFQLPGPSDDSIGATHVLPLSPCGRGWIARRESERDPGEGSVRGRNVHPSPALAWLRLRSRTLSRKGRGQESSPLASYALMAALGHLMAKKSKTKSRKADPVVTEIIRNGVI